MALGVDGNCGGTNTSTHNITTSGLTTANANDYLIWVSYVEGGLTTLTGITDSASATSFSKILRFVTGDGFTSVLEVWASAVTQTLSGVTFTSAGLNGVAYDVGAAEVMAISGSNNTLDPNASLPATTAWTGSANPVNISTSNANDLILACAGIAANHNLSGDTISGGFTQYGSQFVSGSHSASVSFAYDIVSTTQSAVATQPFSGDPNLIIIAIEQGTIAPTIKSRASVRPGLVGL